MSNFGLWEIAEKGPLKLSEASVGLEKNIEDWIEQEPDLLQHGLTILGRQVRTEAGPLDLLALDPQGRWVLIELKAGVVNRTTVGQVLDYAAAFSRMPTEDLKEKVAQYLVRTGTNLNEFEEHSGLDLWNEEEQRETQMFIVGTQRDQGLERMVDFLSTNYDVPISIVIFEVFETGEGAKLLLREITEVVSSMAEVPKKKISLKDTMDYAAGQGTREVLQSYLDLANETDMYSRSFARSIMFTPPTHKNRMLFTVWAQSRRGSKIRVYLGSDVFSEFYPISEEEARKHLGEAGYKELDSAGVNLMINQIRDVFQLVQSRRD